MEFINKERYDELLSKHNTLLRIAEQQQADYASLKTRHDKVTGELASTKARNNELEAAITLFIKSFKTLANDERAKQEVERILRSINAIEAGKEKQRD